MPPDIRQLAAMQDAVAKQMEQVRFVTRAQLAGQLMASFLASPDALAKMDKEDVSYEQGRASAVEMIVDLTDSLLTELDRTAKARKDQRY